MLVIIIKTHEVRVVAKVREPTESYRVGLLNMAFLWAKQMGSQKWYYSICITIRNQS